ncbi:MAG: YHS domain-containing protein [Desulfobacterales bacterium]|nr:MAG: YHS domain-containing protein [Desulfobacterales bacterium]
MATNNSISSTNDTVDPVCQMKVPPGRKHITVTHNRKRYYFCAEACRKSFEENPGKYLTSIPAKRKGLWGRYLERLNKATGGKPPSCCH